jgi:integrase
MLIPWLFPVLPSPGISSRFVGQRRRDFRKAWATACRDAGHPGMLRHDLRRTAVRDMVEQGISEKVAMTITGHRSRSIFDRYHIVAPTDLQNAARKRDEAAQRRQEAGTTVGTTGPVRELRPAKKSGTTGV